MARKLLLENPLPVSDDEEEEHKEFTDSKQNDDVYGEEPPVVRSSNSGTLSASPPHSLSHFDREGTPPSPSLSGFKIEPVPSHPAAAMKSAANPPERLTDKPGLKDATAESERDGADSKKKKKKKEAATTHSAAVGGYEDETRKGSGVIQRLWSEDDEIAILEGMIQYKAKTGCDPCSLSGNFHDFIKDSVHVEVSKNQLMDKIKRLKKKFRVNYGKGEGPDFSKVHDSNAFELSKNIWGKVDANVSEKKVEMSKNDRNTTDMTLEVAHGNLITNPKKRHKKANEEEKIEAEKNLDTIKTMESRENENLEADSKIVELVEVEKASEENGGCVIDFWSQHPYLLDALETIDSKGLVGRFHKGFLLDKFSGMGREETKDWDDKCKKLQLEEMQLDVKKLNLMTELSKAALDAFK